MESPPTGIEKFQAVQTTMKLYVLSDLHAESAVFRPDAQALQAADVVICQVGCISHNAYWRVKDHCKRTGKTCLLVDQPTALRVVRIHPSGENGKVVAAQACIEGAP